MAKANKKTVAAIERVFDRDGMARVNVDKSEFSFKSVNNYGYFLVNTDEFMPLAIKGSMIEVLLQQWDFKPTDVVLVAGNKRLEIMPYIKGKDFQILGWVSEVKCWPGQVVENIEP